MNVYLKNRQRALKLFIKANVPRLRDCTKDHCESMKCFIASNVKQEEVVRNRTMRALVHTPDHYGHGGEVGVVGKLV